MKPTRKFRKKGFSLKKKKSLRRNLRGGFLKHLKNLFSRKSPVDAAVLNSATNNVAPSAETAKSDEIHSAETVSSNDPAINPASPKKKRNIFDPFIKNLTGTSYTQMQENTNAYKKLPSLLPDFIKNHVIPYREILNRLYPKIITVPDQVNDVILFEKQFVNLTKATYKFSLATSTFLSKILNENISQNIRDNEENNEKIGLYFYRIYRLKNFDINKVNASDSENISAFFDKNNLYLKELKEKISEDLNYITSEQYTPKQIFDIIYDLYRSKTRSNDHDIVQSNMYFGVLNKFYLHLRYRYSVDKQLLEKKKLVEHTNFSNDSTGIAPNEPEPNSSTGIAPNEPNLSSDEPDQFKNKETSLPPTQPFSSGGKRTRKKNLKKYRIK